MHECILFLPFLLQLPEQDTLMHILETLILSLVQMLAALVLVQILM
jgi:hypothetical protein